MTSERRPPRVRPRAEDGLPPQYAGRPLPPRAAYRSRFAEEMDDGGASGGRLAAVLLALAVAALVVTQGLWQVTAPDAAGRVLRALLPPLTDLDQTLAANLGALREIAQGEPPDGQVTVPGLPIQVQVTREQAEGDEAALRTAVLRGMSDAVYRDGTDAFLAPGATARGPTILSSRWALGRALGFLTDEQHDSLRIPRLVAAVATLMLAVLTIWLMEGPARLSGPGVSLVIGSVIGALFALAVRLGSLGFYGGDGVADTVVRLVAKDTTNTVWVVAAAFFALGLVLALLGGLAARWDESHPVAHAAAQEPPPRGPRRLGGS